jgi:hypothetical protein
MDPRERATSVWYRVAGLISRQDKDLAIDIIEAEIRAALREAFLEAERLVVSGISGPSVAKTLRGRAEQLIRPKGGTT